MPHFWGLTWVLVDAHGCPLSWLNCKKYLCYCYENLTEYSNRHGELLYILGGWSGIFFQKHPFSSKSFVRQKSSIDYREKMTKIKVSYYFETKKMSRNLPSVTITNKKEAINLSIELRSMRQKVLAWSFLYEHLSEYSNRHGELLYSWSMNGHGRSYNDK